MNFLLKLFPGQWAIYVAVLAASFAAGGTAAWKYQGARLDAVKAEYASFVAQVKVVGEAAQKAATEQTERDKLAKRKADNENSNTLAALRADIKRLRSANPPGSNLPAPSAATSRPDLLCLDRAEYQREDGAALEKLFAGARSLADEGTKSTVDLDSAKRWARP